MTDDLHDTIHALDETTAKAVLLMLADMDPATVARIIQRVADTRAGIRP